MLGPTQRSLLFLPSSWLSLSPEIQMLKHKCLLCIFFWRFSICHHLQNTGHIYTNKTKQDAINSPRFCFPVLLGENADCERAAGKSENSLLLRKQASVSLFLCFSISPCMSRLLWHCRVSSILFSLAFLFSACLTSTNTREKGKQEEKPGSRVVDHSQNIRGERLIFGRN